MKQDEPNDVKGTPNVERVYERLCQLQKMLDRQREMIDDPRRDDDESTQD